METAAVAMSSQRVIYVYRAPKVAKRGPAPGLPMANNTYKNKFSEKIEAPATPALRINLLVTCSVFYFFAFGPISRRGSRPQCSSPEEPARIILRLAWRSVDRYGRSLFVSGNATIWT